MTLVQDRKVFDRFITQQTNKAGLSAAKQDAWSSVKKNPLLRTTVFARARAMWRSEGKLTDFFDWLIENQDAIFALVQKIIQFIGVIS